MTRLPKVLLALAFVALVGAITAWSILPDRSARAAAPAPQTTALPLDVSLIASTSNNGNSNCGNANANTTSCHGILSTLDGKPIVTGSNLKPGGTLTGQLTLTVSGSKSSVTLTQASVTSATCAQAKRGCPSGVGTGNLASYLRLTITDLTTNKTIYDGAFGSVPATAVCGTSAGTCAQWNNNEAHTLRVTVTFPTGTPSQSNLYQGTGASAELDWIAS